MTMRNVRLAVVAGVLGLAVAWAVQAGQGKIDAARVLVGTAAFSDHLSIKPGVTRKITAASLPAPLATPSATNRAQIVRRPANAWPQALPGFKVDLYATGFQSARKILTAPNGDFFVADSMAGEIKVFRGRKADGTPEQTSVFATGLNRPSGIAFYPAGSSPQWIYIGNTNAVVKFPYKSGDLKAGGAAAVVVPELPSGGGHWTRDLAFSQDGRRMFVGVGSASNVDDVDANPKEVHRANVLEFTPEGQFVRVYASGIRNPGGGIVVHPQTGELWVSTNERDALGDNLVPDYVTHVQRGGFYGWPWYYMGDHQDPRHEGKHPELTGHILVPDVLLPPHNASLGFTFYDGRQFPAEYRGDLFAAEHGSWNRATRAGLEVIRVPLDKGHATGMYQDFLTGFTTPDGTAWGRPGGVAIAKDGSMYGTDDGS